MLNNVEAGVTLSDSNDFNNRKVSKSSVNEIVEGGNNSGMNLINTVNLKLTAEKAGIYTGQIIIYTPENVHDVRFLEIKIQAIAPKKDSVLVFKSPARKETAQV